jgi:fused signal recognition particle receptor
MIKWFKREQETTGTDESSIDALANEILVDPPSKPGLVKRFRQGLSKTRHQLGESIGQLLLGKKYIDNELLEELETLLLGADVGIDTTQAILHELSEGLARHQLTDGEAVLARLKFKLTELLQNKEEPPLFSSTKKPLVILMVGVNGAGKTTTIGKLAKQFQQHGKSVMLAAGDTFRAAAVEQLQIWGERNQIPVIAQHTGADSASVIFDALSAAKARGIDVLIADTAGRLHTQNNLMEELKKVKRVMQKCDLEAPHETMLILDASTGQNALNQARQFHAAIGLTAVTMTKLDGTAKGGILFAIAKELKLPFRFLGLGEGIDDLQPFNATQFVEAIFNDDNV